jgi:hypothetical protein
MEVTLEELQVRLNGKEDRPLSSSFKLITNKELPKMSELSRPQIGRYKKENNETKLAWNFVNSDENRIPSSDIMHFEDSNED